MSYISDKQMLREWELCTEVAGCLAQLTSKFYKLFQNILLCGRPCVAGRFIYFAESILSADKFCNVNVQKIWMMRAILSIALSIFRRGPVGEAGNTIYCVAGVNMWMNSNVPLQGTKEYYLNYVDSSLYIDSGH